MAINLNLDMASLARNFSGANGKALIAPYKNALIMLGVLLVISAAYIGAVYMPLKQKNLAKEEELNKTLEMKNQLVTLDSQIEALKKKLDKSKEEYIQSLAHFGNSEDLGALYQTVSTLAGKYNLTVLNVKEIAEAPSKGGKKPAGKDGAKAEGKEGEERKPAADKAEKPTAKAEEGKKSKKTAKPAEPQAPKIEVKEVKVGVEIKGRYADYMKFKEDLALAEILLKINSESVMVKTEDAAAGNIYVQMDLSTYAIDKKPFEGIITEKENEQNS